MPRVCPGPRAHRGSGAAELRQRRPADVRRGHQHAANPLLGQHHQVRGLGRGAGGAVHHQHAETRRPRGLLGAAQHLDEERIGQVQREQRQHLAAAGAQQPRALAAHEAQLRDRRLDPGPGARGHHVGAVQHVRHRADRHPGQLGHVPHARALRHPRPLYPDPPGAVPRRLNGRAHRSQHPVSAAVRRRSRPPASFVAQSEPGRPQVWTGRSGDASRLGTFQGPAAVAAAPPCVPFGIVTVALERQPLTSHYPGSKFHATRN